MKKIKNMMITSYSLSLEERDSSKSIQIEGTIIPEYTKTFLYDGKIEFQIAVNKGSKEKSIRIGITKCNTNKNETTLTISNVIFYEPHLQKTQIQGQTFDHWHAWIIE